MHILSAQQFDTEQLDEIFRSADHFREAVSHDHGRRQLIARYTGEQLLNLFYEPSTRTRVSFGLAARRLGMGVEGTENAREFSSTAKGETLEDTIRVMDEYQPSIVVLRHHETGAADRAAAVSRVPIINAGDGKGEHPTQAVLDLYTVQEQKGRLNDLTVVIGGDLAHGRTARSLAKLLALYSNNNIRFVSTPDLQIGEDIKTYLEDHGVDHEETSDMYSALRGADVVYWTRLQKERLDDDSVGNNFVIDSTALEVLPDDAIIMHPLPRIDEIHQTVDHDPRAVYFRQAGNGMYIRMALIDRVIQESR